MQIGEAYHFPPELTDLLAAGIPLLCASKASVISFFRGAGVPQQLTSDFEARLAADRATVKKTEIARAVVERLNQRGDAMIRPRREILKRISEWDDFSQCWKDDRLPAEGFVAKVRQLVDQKDSFTRMRLEKDDARRRHTAEHEAQLKKVRDRSLEIQALRVEMAALFGLTDAYERAKKLESLLNRVFKAYGISVREAFTLRSAENSRVVEQVDGLILLDGELYLVEVKWYAESAGPDVIAQHLVRVCSRGEARGLFVTVNGYTHAAIQSCKEYLQRAVFCLATLDEFLHVLEQEGDLAEMLRRKVVAAIADKTPYSRQF